MCYPAKCPTCRKITWGGCGRHVDQVMATVPEDRRCTCEARQPKKPGFLGLFR